MKRRGDDADADLGAREREDPERAGGLVGAAVRAPLTQGRDASFPLELEGDDLAEPPEEQRIVRGEPTEPVIHAPTTTVLDPRPVATGECTIEDLWGHPLCNTEEER